MWGWLGVECEAPGKTETESASDGGGTAGDGKIRLDDCVNIIIGLILASVLVVVWSVVVVI